MTPSVSMDEILQRRGEPVYSSDGEKIGKVEDIYYDDTTGEPEWLGVGTGFFSTKHILVPIEGLEPEQDGVRVPYAKEMVEGAPDIDTDHLPQHQEDELVRYYAVGNGQVRAASTPSLDVDEQTTVGRSEAEQASVTRSEEELQVGKREVDAGRVRLRKWVETEPVEADVTLRRETVRVEREPINQPVGSAEIGEEDVEVRLTAEEPVVGKEVVAKERVSLEKESETEEETIAEEVRRERVEVEGSDNPQR